jgi:iron complex transport system substrate-binding protein
MAQDCTPQRIVSLQPSATVILARLDALERVVACTRYCRDVCPQIDGKAVIVADSWTAQARQILDARPDLVIAAVPYHVEALAEILKAGIRFLGLAPRTMADIYTDIATIAGVVGASSCGQELIAEMRRAIAAVAAEWDASPRPRVFCEEWGKPIIASQPWVAELVHAAGAEFIGNPGSQIEANAVRDADPDVMFVAWCGAGDRVPLEKVVRERGWQNTRAARDGRVYCISDELLNTPAPTLLRGLHALAAGIRNLPNLPPGIRRIDLL